ncbi:methyltransferase-like protein 25B [Saccostrea echinata]|uniref:methyltransferase-like protein 25B n=1 Tax=Saccostrea echinata TaxID=191078 RepID=UPI002A8047F4|nr:methyltransferase-like protein 25B [Saccostrea echinata]
MLFDKDSIDSIQQYITKLTEFLSIYTWIVDAYVSDYFTQNHWDKLPSLWTESLLNTEPTELVWLLTDESPVSKVWPLSLLAFRQCTRTYSLPRSQQEVKVQDLLKLYLQRHGQDQKKISLVPQPVTNPDRSYNEYLRKHVKPKKLHEIRSLGKTLKVLGNACNCEHIVDVGAGQGHLSRLLTFQHGFKVTTVEAEGCHAPKAQKYDRDAHRQISKVKGHTETESEAELPCHVTCYITTDTTQGKFIDIVQKSFNRSNVSSHCESEHGLNINKMQSESVDEKQNVESCCRESNKKPKLTNSSTCTDMDCDDQDAFLTSPKTGQSHGILGVHISSKNYLSLSSKNNFCENCEKCSHSKSFSSCDSNSSHLNNHLTGEQAMVDSCQCDKHQDTKINQECEVLNSETEEFHREDTPTRQHFLLTGLHACGDLTPTMLRVFTSCPDIAGLASVGCCYMKMSTPQNTKTDPVGYPMSNFVSSLPHSVLSYEAREMACHFADSYIQRLKDNPPSLRLHCYRAALQWIILHIKPDFVTGEQKLTIRKAEKLTFKQYVSLGLQRFGLNCEVPEEILEGATERLKEWRQVVAFYTLRLSLSPVVESLLLLDRQMYLYEQGISSLALPVFDPKISPRNFVLLAKK